MENMDDDEAAEVYEETIRLDLGNLKDAMNKIIDPLSTITAANSLDDVDDETFANLLATLDFAKFIVSGVMYLHGKPLCGHNHEDDDEEC